MKNFDDFVNDVVLSQQDIIGKVAGEATSAIFEQYNVKALPADTIRTMNITNMASNLAALQIVLEVLEQYHQWANEEQ